jgi:hypothetical protein
MRLYVFHVNVIHVTCYYYVTFMWNSAVDVDSPKAGKAAAV